MAQWKRAGPITQRSEDQNLALLDVIFSLFGKSFCCPKTKLEKALLMNNSNRQRVAEWRSGSVPGH